MTGKYYVLVDHEYFEKDTFVLGIFTTMERAVAAQERIIESLVEGADICPNIFEVDGVNRISIPEELKKYFPKGEFD